MPELSLIRDQIKELAAMHGAVNVWVLGSYATGGQASESDLDLLVDLEAGRGLLDLIGFKEAVEQELGIRIDVATDGALKCYLRSSLMKEARQL